MVEFCEIAPEKLLDEGVWREVPVVSSVVGIVKSAGSIREGLFVKEAATSGSRRSSPKLGRQLFVSRRVLVRSGERSELRTK
jgi:hypothetical protein